MINGVFIDRKINKKIKEKSKEETEVKRFRTIIAIAVVVLMIATGVAIGRIGKGDENSVKEPAEVKTEVKYEVIEENDALQDDIFEAIMDLKVERGYFVFGEPAFEVENEKNYLLISSGEKRTGGYDIVLEEIEEKEGVLKVTVKETEPGDDEMTIQALTYPYIVLALDEGYDEYAVVNKAGEEFRNLAEVEIEDPNIEREEGLKQIPDTDPTIGEAFVEGEVIAVDVENRRLELEIHLDTHTPDVGPEFEILEDALIRQLEDDKETEISFDELEEGMIVGMILTEEGEVRAVINHEFEF
ncbi:protease complex subunit PrcB family protein [Natranaerofaba carboxydovora]|uniref:protease complex subunit PrcB family protein n=1 Tax=Natranaerofaba carboxydovora TaxID=2742683 RepID=UPI001F139A05|nr:protease complex subunit PrcB family protein [Natranaerofaba carboxydovora]UMZ74276.1 hypothetical protein ACONDI_01863 [Natranaerofaba carboxydovora]